MNQLWLNDKVQFARLICEIVATQETLDIDELCASMDLAPSDVHELLDRAHDVWEDSKARLTR